MDSHAQSDSGAGHAPPGHGHVTPLIALLERIDNLYHVIVAALFIILATAVLVHTCIGLVDGMKQIVPHAGAEVAATPPAPIVSIGENPQPAPDPFLRTSLEVLSSILYVVIILELLRTILTYLQTHDIQAIMQEFIVVGIISSVRKILLVGAQSSLTGGSGQEFVQEAMGTLISIGGILLLICGLVLLKRAYGVHAAATSS